MKHKLSSKGMILDICSMRSRARKLLESKPVYSKILETLTSTDYYYDDDTVIPTLKSLAQTTELSYDVARRQLKLIYKDLCPTEERLVIPFDFTAIEIDFGIEGFRSTTSMSVNRLPILPRVGEIVRVPYFKELTGADYFHVKEVYHELLDGKQRIYISLKYGSVNRYWELRKDQAIATGEFSFMDRIRKSDYELQELLNLRPGKAW